MTEETSAIDELRVGIEDLSEQQAGVLLGWMGGLRRRFGVKEASAGPLGDLLSIVPEASGQGRARMRLTVDPALRNPGGVLHGGVVYTLVDYSMARAVLHGLPEGEHCTTIEIKISYLEAVREGTLIVETEIVRQGRNIVFLTSDVTDDKDRLVATATGSMFILRLDRQRREEGE